MPPTPLSPRSADTEFTATAELHLFWQDLTEAGSLKLREVLKYCARGEAVMWQTDFDRDAFWRRSGQMIPVYGMDVRVSPDRVHIHEPSRVTHTRRFGKNLDGAGRVARLVSEADTVIEGLDDHGAFFQVARLVNYGFFVRRTGPREKRRVKRLHPSLNLTPVPKRVLHVPTVDELRYPPAGWGRAPMAGRFGLVRDEEPRRWTYSDTDGNQHVHAMAYVGRAEDFVMQALGRREIPVEWYYPCAARVLFRRPAFNGDVYFRSGRFFRAPARDAYLFVGAFSPLPPAAAEAARPSILVQIEVARRPDTAGRES